jgi:hypothetical protein
MSINSVVVDLHTPADATLTDRGNRAVAVIRRLVGRPRWSQERPYLKIGDSYRIRDRRHGHEVGTNWLRSHH